MWAALTGWLHGTALVGAEGARAADFTAVAIRRLGAASGFLTTYAPQADAGHYPGDDATAPPRTPVPSSAAWPGLPAAATGLDALQARTGTGHAPAWTCREPLDHLALGLTGYAGLLIARPTDRSITLFTSLDPRAPGPACSSTRTTSPARPA